MSLSLVLNNNNVVKNGLNNQYTYNFITGGITIPLNSSVCISNCTIPYAWYNINQQLYNNAVFQYTMPTNDGTQTYTVTLDNGFYAVTDIDQFMQTVFIENGHYLVDENGDYVYYISMSSNTTYYANQVITWAIPNALPAGWTNPANMYLPPSPTTPQFVVIDNNFGSIIGYTQGSYPATPQSTTTDFLSSTTPNASPVNSLIIRCSLVDNNAVMPSDILDSMPINASFGNNIVYEPTFPRWIRIRPGKYTTLTITFYDQNLNIIQSRDPNVAITLLLQLGQ